MRLVLNLEDESVLRTLENSNEIQEGPSDMSTNPGGKTSQDSARREEALL